MRGRTFAYQILIIAILIVLLGLGVYIGIQYSKPPESAKDKDYNVEVVDNKEVDIYNEEQPPELADIEVNYVDIYTECNHTITSRSIEYGMEFEQVKEDEIARNESDHTEYELVKSSDNILMFERTFNCKCKDHYLLKLEDNKVVIYCTGDEGKYELYRKTDIEKDHLRDTMVTQLEKGMEANSAEELYMIMEDLES